MCSYFAALYLTLGYGHISMRAWENTYGSQLGKAEITQEIITCDRLTVQGSIEHWSSLDTGEDRGANAFLVEARIAIY